MAKRIHLPFLLLASMTFVSMAEARQKFIPPANLGNTQEAEPVDLMGGNGNLRLPVIETQTQWQPARQDEYTYTDENTYTYEEPAVETQAPVPVERSQPAHAQSVIVADTATATTGTAGNVLPSRPDSFFDSLRFVDIRDLANGTYNKLELVGTANLLMRVMEANPERFVGPAQGLEINSGVSTSVRFYPSGPLGPSGHNEKIVDGNGNERNVFHVDKSNEETIKNSILGAELEGIHEVRREGGDVGAKIVDLRLLLFVRDDSRPSQYTKADGSVEQQSFTHYFRRVNVRVDWTQPKPEGNRVIVKGLAEPDIPLFDTQFEIKVGLLDRKVVMMDRKHSIYKVFPAGVGSLDIRTDVTPYNDSSRALIRYGGETNLGKSVPVIDTMTGEFPKAILTKASVWRESQWGTNTRSRTWPDYYQGRPFMGIRDISSGDPVYKQVGMHYRITTPLLRAFVSHGCIRVRDQDLYQEDAILNDGKWDSLSIQVLNKLDISYDQFNPIMPQDNKWYNAVVYSKLPSNSSVSCKPINLNQSYIVKWAGNCNVKLSSSGNCPGKPEGRPDLGEYFSPIAHTISDDECLTKVETVSQNVEPVLAYFRGETADRPHSLMKDMEHYPVAIENGEDPNEQESEETIIFSNESGRRPERFNLGNFIGGLFGGGQQQPEVERPIAIPRELSAAERSQLTARYNQLVKCVNDNNAYRQQNRCQNRKISAIFLSDAAKNCNAALANQQTCYDQAMAVGSQLGLKK